MPSRLVPDCSASVACLSILGQVTQATFRGREHRVAVQVLETRSVSTVIACASATVQIKTEPMTHHSLCVLCHEFPNRGLFDYNLSPESQGWRKATFPLCKRQERAPRWDAPWRCLNSVLRSAPIPRRKRKSRKISMSQAFSDCPAWPDEQSSIP